MQNIKVAAQRRRSVALRACIAAGAASLGSIIFFLSLDAEIVDTQTVDMRRLKPELVVQSGHSGHIPAIDFSPDGKIIATGSDDTSVKLWNVESGKELRTITGHSAKVRAVDFSPDGGLLASAGEDWVVRLWDVATGRTAGTLEHHDDAISSVDFAPDGKLIASGSDDTSVKIWNIQSGRPVKVLGTPQHAYSEQGVRQEHAEAIKSVAFGPRNDLVAAGSADGIVTIWSLADGSNRRLPTSFKNEVHSLEFTNDGKRLVSGSHYEIIVWDTATGQRLHVLEKHSSDAFQSNIIGFAISPNGGTIANINLGGEIKLWETGSGDLRKTLVKTPVGFFNSIVFSPDGKRLATAGTRRFDQFAIRLWNAGDGSEIGRVEEPWGELFETSFSADRQMLTTTLGGHVVGLWDLSGREQFRSIEIERGKEGSFSIAQSHDPKSIGFAFPSTFQLWNAETGEPTKVWDHSDLPSPYGSLSAIMPGGKRIVTAVIGSLAIVEIDTGRPLKNIQTYTNETTGLMPASIALDRSGRILAVGSYDGKTRLWDLESGKPLRDLCDQETAATQIVFSDDGKLIATTADVANVKVCDVATGVEIATLRGPQPFLTAKAVAFSPDARMAATLGWDGTARIFAIPGGREIRSLPGPSLRVGQTIALSFSSDGRILVASGRKQMKLWEVSSGRELASLVTPGENDWAVVTPEGLFDASDGAQQLMHFVVADRRFGYETLSLDQLKSRYHVPGLLRRIMAGETLPKVGAFSLTLFPEVAMRIPRSAAPAIDIDVRNRGGGIGRVEVRLNGSELTSDARAGRTIDARAAAVTLPVGIPKDRLRAGANKVEVIAWNLEGDARSRNYEAVIMLEPGGLIRRSSDVVEVETEKAMPADVNFYAIVSGVSDYAGDALDLRYAAKDAEDMAKALTVGARKYFCGAEMAKKAPCERVHVRLLSTETDSRAQFGGLADVPDLRRSEPTKPNFAAVFAEIAQKAKPKDVVLVYLSGHGTAIASDDAVRESAFPDMYLYATRDAVTLDRTALANQTERETKTVSSLELAKWVFDIKADKKVMILDTCAAGAVQKDLTTQTRSTDALQLRSIDRLRERTGFYILMGSASDKVSYEANEYRQGLLTYSLLEAMTVGQALRDGRFVDVESWFGFAEDKVENMAKGLGGIQRPSVFKSSFARTFDIGRVEREELAMIPLTRRVPLILQPELREKDKFTDGARLSEKLETMLLEQSMYAVRGDAAAINYVRASVAANGLSPRGFYTINGEEVTIEVSLIRDETEVARVKVTGTNEDVLKRLLAAVLSAAQVR